MRELKVKNTGLYERNNLGRFTGKGQHPKGMKGKKRTLEQRQAMSQRMKGRKITWKNKIGKANSIALRGDKSSLWKDGRSGIIGYNAHRCMARRAHKIGAIGS